MFLKCLHSSHMGFTAWIFSFLVNFTKRKKHLRLLDYLSNNWGAVQLNSTFFYIHNFYYYSIIATICPLLPTAQVFKTFRDSRFGQIHYTGPLLSNTLNSSPLTIDFCTPYITIRSNFIIVSFSFCQPIIGIRNRTSRFNQTI